MLAGADESRDTASGLTLAAMAEAELTFWKLPRDEEQECVDLRTQQALRPNGERGRMVERAGEVTASGTSRRGRDAVKVRATTRAVRWQQLERTASSQSTVPGPAGAF